MCAKRHTDTKKNALGSDDTNCTCTANKHQFESERSVSLPLHQSLIYRTYTGFLQVRPIKEDVITLVCISLNISVFHLLVLVFTFDFTSSEWFETVHIWHVLCEHGEHRHDSKRLNGPEIKSHLCCLWCKRTSSEDFIERKRLVLRPKKSSSFSFRSTSNLENNFRFMAR